MQKILIVDDELPARELLKMSIDWKRAGCELAAEAKNGREAFRLYEQLRPDVIITDIQMPIMDGIELIRLIKEQNPEQKFIILSCHESFQYAKMAMQLGVSDYLIKDSYTETELYSLLQSISDDKKQKRQNQLDEYVINKNKALGDLLGNIIINKRQEDLLELEKQWFSQYYNYCFLIAKLEDKSRELPDSLDRKAILKKLNAKDEGLAFFLDIKRVAVLFRYRNSHSYLNNFNLRFEAIRDYRADLENDFGLRVSIGVSQSFQSAGQLMDKYEEAVSALEYCAFVGRGKIVYYEGIKSKSQVNMIERMNENFRTIQEAFDAGKLPEVEGLVETIYEKDLQGMMQCHYLHYVNSLFFGYITYLISRYDIPFELLYQEETVSLDVLNNMETCRDMRIWVIDKLKRITSYLEERTGFSSKVKQAIAYMNDHYREDIAVEDIANNVAVHKVYLSRIFKEEVGKNLYTYLNEVRVNKAKELLDKGELRISDIVYETGFNSAQSFYYTFKQMTGVSPKEYKRK